MTRCLTLLTLSFLATTTLVEAGKNFDFITEYNNLEKLEAKSKKLIQSIEFAQDKSPKLMKALEQKLNIITTRCVQNPLPPLSGEEAEDWYAAQETASQEKSKFLEAKKAIFIANLTNKEKTETKKYIKKITRQMREVSKLGIFKEDSEEGEILTLVEKMKYLRYKDEQEREETVSQFLQQEKKLHRILREVEEMKEEVLQDYQAMKWNSSVLYQDIERASHYYRYNHKNYEILDEALRFLRSLDSDYRVGL